MEASSIIEIDYPITFRGEDAKELGNHLHHRHNVDLIGMKRVGISNFLRFFLYHKDIVKTYIHPEERHLFIPVDLNDLVEREIYPFWSLTLKRIVDVVESSDLPDLDKERIESRFLNAIQSQDLFLMIDSVRKTIGEIVATGVHPTIFFLRFDRMQDVVNVQFFDNLQGLKDATHQKLSYVFTSFRSLDSLAPSVFTKPSLGVFSHQMFIKPAKKEDAKIIYETFKGMYELEISQQLEGDILSVVGGYVQYLQLALIILHEKKDALPKTADELQASLVQDERIVMQGEELWESLKKDEKDVLLKIHKNENVSSQEKTSAQYLWDSGFVYEEAGKVTMFSPLFSSYLEHKGATENENQAVHFSKKEHMLHTLLANHANEICEREEIVRTVWPEYSEYGVSDWAIDRLVARVRSKLKQQKSLDEIVTIRTRGYKLVSNT